MESKNINRKIPSRRFDLDALKKQDKDEILKTTEIFPILSQPQKDLIRHQAPMAYDAIMKSTDSILASIKEANDSAYRAQANTAKLAHETHRETLKSSNSSSEKRDSYEKNDRMHEREIVAQNHQHQVTMETIKDIGTKAIIGATLVGTTFLIKRLFD